VQKLPAATAAWFGSSPHSTGGCALRLPPLISSVRSPVRTSSELGAKSGRLLAVAVEARPNRVRLDPVLAQYASESSLFQEAEDHAAESLGLLGLPVHGRAVATDDRGAGEQLLARERRAAERPALRKHTEPQAALSPRSTTSSS
jgi:hypothetical protein